MKFDRLPVIQVCLALQAEGQQLSLSLLLRQIESGINIFSDLERKQLQEKPQCS